MAEICQEVFFSVIRNLNSFQAGSQTPLSFNAEREKYVAQRMKEVAGTNTLDAVVIAATREQGQKRNFQFE